LISLRGHFDPHFIVESIVEARQDAPQRYFQKVSGDLLVGRTWKNPPSGFGAFDFQWAKHNLGDQLISLNRLPHGLPDQFAIPPEVPRCEKKQKNRKSWLEQ
jgi:hypothetical protein